MRISTPGEIRVEHYARLPHYVELPHGVLTDIWGPAAGLRIHATSMMVSVEGAGVLVLQYDATVFSTLHFNEKRAVPVHSGGDIMLPKDAVLRATFTADSSPAGAFVTAFGHEDP